jgi:hypothetical protein
MLHAHVWRFFSFDMCVPIFIFPGTNVKQPKCKRWADCWCDLDVFRFPPIAVYLLWFSLRHPQSHFTCTDNIYIYVSFCCYPWDITKRLLLSIIVSRIGLSVEFPASCIYMYTNQLLSYILSFFENLQKESGTKPLTLFSTLKKPITNFIYLEMISVYFNSNGQK